MIYQLLQPESGWIRIDDSNNKIKYIGENWNFTNDTSIGAYNDTYHGCAKNPNNSSIDFYFYGTKIRVLDACYPDRVSSINIEIDDDTEDYSPNGNLGKFSAVVYEKTSLSKKIHHVKISTNKTSGYWGLDAIDIDEDGYILSEEDFNNYLVKKDNKYYTFENDILTEVVDYKTELLADYTTTKCFHDINVLNGLVDFASDNVSLISNKNFNLVVDGLKSTQEMIATLEPLNMKKYATIHNITPNYTMTGNGSIKIAFSFDDGITWKTWDSTNDWTDLSNVEVPLKLYENFSDADKTAWSNAQAEININGIDIRNLSNVTFPSDVKKMCFAIVFNRPTYTDTATLNSFDILYDGLKTYVGLDRDKCGVKFSGDTITVTPTSDVDQLLITMITGTN